MAKRNRGEKKSLSWVTVLGMDHILYLLVAKGRSVRLMTEPTKDEMRKRGRRNWQVVGIVPKGHEDAHGHMVEMFKRFTEAPATEAASA